MRNDFWMLWVVFGEIWIYGSQNKKDELSRDI